MAEHREGRPTQAKVETASSSTAVKTETTLTPTRARDPHCCLSLDWSDLATCARFGITCESSCARDLFAVAR